MIDKPLISVIINNYNYASFLRDAIDSALSQSYPHIEIIVVDDGSSDNSRQIIAEYNNRVVSIFKENGGQASAFNAGFAASSGNIICLLDADDYFRPNKLSQILAFWNTYPNADWLFHALEDVDSKGVRLRDIAPLNTGYFDFRPALRKGENLPALPATTGLCFRRKVLEKVLPMPEQLRISADQFLRLAVAFVAPGALLPDAVAVHRIHGDNWFEFRKDVATINAETNVRTAYYLMQRFPQTKPFANKLYAHALGQLMAECGFRGALKMEETQHYIKNYGTADVFIRGVIRALYNYCKAIGLKTLHKATI